MWTLTNCPTKIVNVYGTLCNGGINFGGNEFQYYCRFGGIRPLAQGRAGDKRGKEVKELLSVVGQQSVTSEKKSKEKA